MEVGEELYEVSTRSRPKAAGGGLALWVLPSGKFQHAAARRRLVTLSITKIILKKFQHAAARRRLVYDSVVTNLYEMVSTRSRPKAAGARL